MRIWLNLKNYKHAVNTIITTATTNNTITDIPEDFPFQNYYGNGAEPHEAAADALHAAGIQHNPIEF